MHLKLYGNWRSSSSHRVQIALRLKDLAFDYHPIDLTAREQEEAAFEALHPGKMVPVLVEGDRVLSQSSAILEYLDARFADQGVRLIPADSEMAAQVREVCAYINSFAQPFILPGATRRRLVEALSSATAAEAEALPPALQAFVREHTELALAEIERLVSRLVSRPDYPAHPTLVECFVIPQLSGSQRLGCSFSHHATLQAMFDRCMAQPAFIESSPEVQIDAPSKE